MLFKKSQHVKSKLNQLVKWILPQIVSALLIAAAISGSTLLLQNLSKNHEEDKLLSNINIGVSNEYMNYNLGVPIIEFAEENELRNCFYKLNTVTIRGVFDENKLIAYFITITDKNRELFLSEFVPFYNNEKLGTFSFSQIDNSEEPDYIDGNVSANLVYSYYYETYYNGNPGEYNYYCYAILPYGFIDKDSGDLLFDSSEYFINSVKSPSIELFKYERILARPNSIGIIDVNYIDKINPIFPNDDWNWYTSNILR